MKKCWHCKKNLPKAKKMYCSTVCERKYNSTKKLTHRVFREQVAWAANLLAIKKMSPERFVKLVNELYS